jgi:hypothetical protein
MEIFGSRDLTRWGTSELTNVRYTRSDDGGALTVDRSWYRPVDPASAEGLVVRIRPTRVAAMGIDRVAIPQLRQVWCYDSIKEASKAWSEPFLQGQHADRTIC